MSDMSNIDASALHRKIIQIISSNTEMTVNQLVSELLCAFPEETLGSIAQALVALVSSKTIRRVLRVVSPTTKKTISEFEFITDVPGVIFDPFCATNLTIEMDDIHVIYSETDRQSEQ